MNNDIDLPSISVIIPTLNSSRTIEMCLQSVVCQSYPKKKVEIIVADGGSLDKTKKIALKYGAKIVQNKLKTGEAGKAIGAKLAKNKILAFIDSDNILPHKNWFKKMIVPFQDFEIVATEPLYYTYRTTDHYLTRYFSLLGMSDPLCLFLGNYDRYSHLTMRWTDLKVKAETRDGYFKLQLEKYNIPTIGANGFLIKSQIFSKCQVGDYFFDIDIIPVLVSNHKQKIAKVKTGIIHLYTGNLKTFAKKQERRIKDFLYFKKQGEREYNWRRNSSYGLFKFVIYNVLVIPLFIQSLRGYIKKKDWAWFIHPLICEITLFIYSYGFVVSLFKKQVASRVAWSQ